MSHFGGKFPVFTFWDKFSISSTSLFWCSYVHLRPGSINRGIIRTGVPKPSFAGLTIIYIILDIIDTVSEILLFVQHRSVKMQ